MSIDLLEAYRRMYLIRYLDEEIIRRYPEGKMRLPVHLSIGQEAAAVGVMMALPEGAKVFASHRSHGPYLAKGGDVDALVAELYGKSSGCSGGWGGSMYLSDDSVGFMGSFGVVGDCVSVATGNSLAIRLHGSDSMACAFFGDAAVETGQFWESLNFAATHQLPILYICENNGYATQTPIEQRQPSTSIHSRVDSIIPAFWTDDRDGVEETFRSTKDVLQELPTFLEIHTYRYRAHVGMDYDWDMGYRSEEEVKAAMAHDPLDAIERGHSNNYELLMAAETIRYIVDEAFAKAEAAPWPEGLK